MGDVLEGAAEKLRLGVTEQITQGPVDPEPPAVGGDQGHAAGRMLERPGEAFLALAQGHVGLLAGGDILDGAGFPDRLALIIIDHFDDLMNVPHLPVRTDDAMLEVHRT